MKNFASVALVWLSPLLIPLPASADELVLPAPALRALGLRPVRHAPVLSRATHPDPTPGTLWPVTFKSQAHSIAQNYVQHQDYGGGQYYHGGCDLRTVARSWAVAPIDGVLEGGYYGYETQADGQDVKWWKPWDGSPEASLYFELAVVSDDGYRYELHHVDPMTLPQETVRWLDQGGVRVTAGAKLAHVAKWPGDYDHVHFNLVRPDGVHVNPEAFSQALPVIVDSIAPRILAAFTIDAQNRVAALRDGARIAANVTEIVVETTETRDGNAYVQTPPLFQARFDSGEVTGEDFRKTLTGADGAWRDIRQVFLPKLRTPSGATIRNAGNYGEGQFLVRIPLPRTAHGPFEVRLEDTAGNAAVLRATRD